MRSRTPLALTYGLFFVLIPSALAQTIQLPFSALEGGEIPPPDGLVNTSTPPGLAFTLSPPQYDVPGQSWLKMSATSGTAPALVLFFADATGLVAGTYGATVTDTIGTTVNTVRFTLTIVKAPPSFDVSPGVVTFHSTTATATSLFVRNAGGGGPQSFTSNASASGAVQWLSVNPPLGQTGAAVTLSANPQGLQTGTYVGRVHFTSTSGSLDVPVTLIVPASGPSLTVSPVGVQFVAQQGAGTSQTESVSIGNDGDSILAWKADILTGNFLTVNPATGSAVRGGPSALTVSVNTTPLAAGDYYGLIRVSAAGAASSPQYVVVTLRVTSATPAPIIRPGGVLLKSPDDGSAVSQTIRVIASSTVPISFAAGATTASGGNWLTVTLNTGSASTASPGQITVTANPAGLSDGLYNGLVAIQFADGTVRAVPVLFVVLPGASQVLPGASQGFATRQAACAPSQLALLPTSVAGNFNTPAGFPLLLSVQLLNDCGNPQNGQVAFSFSTGDPTLSAKLTDPVNGIYSATWVPGRAGAANVTARATAGGLPPAQVQIPGQVAVNPFPPPRISPGGTVHAFSFQKGAPLAPGTAVSIFGSSLSTADGGSSIFPFPMTLNGASVLTGALNAPLYYAGNGQLNVEIPADLAPNAQYPIVASVGGRISVPETIAVGPVSPGIAAFADGTLIAQHGDFSLVDASNPARAGEPLVIYLAGLGATNPPVGTDVPAPGVEPLARVVNTPVLLLDGKPISTAFAGLTPGSVGLYQINFQLPADTRPGVHQVVVTQNDIPSNTTTLTVGN